MGNIVSTFFISLDGVVESPDQWHFPYSNDELGAAIERRTEQESAYLMGRVLYEEWASHWPDQPDDDAFARFINAAPKYVLSHTLHTATWNNTTIVSEDEAATIRALKEETDGDIGMFGSATTVRWLLAQGLLDELRLFLDPIAVGHGQRLFDNTPTYPLRLVNQERFETGVLYLTYATVS